MSKSVLLAASLALIGSISNAQSICNPESILAMKNVYDLKMSSNERVNYWQAICRRDENSKSTAVSGSYGAASGSYDRNSYSYSNICSRESREATKEEYISLATATLSPETQVEFIRACTAGGVYFTVSESRDGVVSVSGSYAVRSDGGYVPNAIWTKIDVDPRNIACVGVDDRASINKRLTSNVTTVSCRRPHNFLDSIIMSVEYKFESNQAGASEESRTTSLASPSIRTVPAQWEFRNTGRPSPHHFRCREKSTRVTTPFYSCKVDLGGKCGSGYQQEQLKYCASQYGSSVRYGPGTRVIFLTADGREQEHEGAQPW